MRTKLKLALKNVLQKGGENNQQVFKDKVSFIKSIPKNGSVLEIGPFYNPICRGENIKYFDILSQAELIQRAEDIIENQDLSNIPNIDFVSPTGDLSIINEKFDVIVSSHVIEHQLDLIKHLNMVNSLLNEGGSYYLIVPDKRYCFDHFINESTIADVINGNFEKKEKHSIKSVIENKALTTHNSAVRHWEGDHGDISNNIDKIKKAIADFKTGKYIDVHAWYFTPDSFKNIVKKLDDLNLIDFSITKLYPTRKETFEFYTVLQKKA